MKLKEGLVMRQVGDHFVAIATGKLTLTFPEALILSGNLAVIFELLREETTKEEVIEELLKIFYNATREQIEPDVDDFLNLLRTKQLLDE